MGYDLIDFRGVSIEAIRSGGGDLGGVILRQEPIDLTARGCGQAWQEPSQVVDRVDLQQLTTR